MPTARQQHIFANGTRFWSAVQGSGPGVVCLHGGPGACDYFGPLADMIDDLSMVIRYDQRGCGRSPAPPPYTMDLWLQDLDALRAHFGLEGMVLLSHSWAPGLALAYALRYPARVRGIVMISAYGCLGRGDWNAQYSRNRRAKLSEAEWEEFSQVSDAIAAARASADQEERHTTLYAKTDMAASTPVSRYLRFDCPPNYEVNRILGRDAFAASHDYQEGIRRLTLSVLALHGAEDPRPAWPIEQFVTALPRGRFHLVPGAGHFPWIEQPERLREQLRAFLMTLN